MALNIKNERTEALARQVAAATGESVTEAITVALEERLRRVCRAPRAGMAERLLAIGKDVAAHMDETGRTMDVNELLYDERGLPR